MRLPFQLCANVAVLIYIARSSLRGLIQNQFGNLRIYKKCKIVICTTPWAIMSNTRVILVNQARAIFRKSVMLIWSIAHLLSEKPCNYCHLLASEHLVHLSFGSFELWFIWALIENFTPFTIKTRTNIIYYSMKNFRRRIVLKYLIVRKKRCEVGGRKGVKWDIWYDCSGLFSLVTICTFRFAQEETFLAAHYSCGLCAELP